MLFSNFKKIKRIPKTFEKFSSNLKKMSTQSLYRFSFLQNKLQKPENLIKFENYIDTVYLVYDFKGPSDQPIRFISKKNQILIYIISIISLYEFSKFVYNGIADNFIHRLYLCDVVKFAFVFLLSQITYLISRYLTDCYLFI